MNSNIILMSPADSNIYKFFERQFKVIKSDCLNDFISYERYHADMQALNINGHIFVNSSCQNLISKLTSEKISFTECSNVGSKYPANVALNAAFTGKYLICKESALHLEVKNYCEKNHIKIINVNQGYAKCSTLVLNETAIITDDESIAKAAKSYNVNVLKIEKGDIFLDENNVGFIGGASTVIGKTVYFFGDIKTHRNSKDIIKHIENAGLNYTCIHSKGLTDIGGSVILK